MGWELSVFRGNPRDLEDEERFGALDRGLLVALVREGAPPDTTVEEAATQIVLVREATLTDMFLAMGDGGVLRAVKAEIHFETTKPVEQQRAEARELLALFFTLAERLDARLYDHFRCRFLVRAELEEIVAGLRAADGGDAEREPSPPLRQAAPYRDLSRTSDGEAAAHLDAYVAGATGRLARLRRTVAGSGGPQATALDCSRQSLAPLWRWFVGWQEEHRSDEDGEGLPTWCDPAQPHRLAPATLWAIDGTASYLAAVLQNRVPGLDWMLSDEDTDRNEPVLARPGSALRLNPVRVVGGLVADVVESGEGCEEETLLAACEVYEAGFAGGFFEE